MESIHKPDSRPWILAGKVIVKDFIEMWDLFLPNIEIELNINENNLRNCVKNELGIEDEMIDLLDEDTSANSLHCVGEDEELYVSYEKTFDLPNSVKLETLRLQKLHFERYSTDRCYRTASLQSLRYRNRLIKVDNMAVDYDESQLNGLKREAILTVQFYRPVRSSTQFGNCHRYSFICDQELSVLSSQCLTQLRDAFSCTTDITNPCDCSEDPRKAHNNTAADFYKSGFFFINNTFFNDMRHPFNREYSKNIIEWSEDPNRGIGPFSTALMEETKFSDLTLQLGYPYLYQHQGDCEHIMVFSDIRLLKPYSDSSDPSDYPKILSTNRRTKVRCGFCNLTTAKWITLGNNRLPVNPFYFCVGIRIGSEE